MDEQTPGADTQTLVIVGNGMTSHRLCHKLVQCGATRGLLRVVVFGEEPRPAYDRVHLTEMFAGRSPESLALAPRGWYEENGIALFTGDPVIAIDRDECAVRAASGAVVPYDRLVFATGSRPFVPPIEGTDLAGVFVYRTVEDLERIMAFGRGARSIAVIGGGLLGLEAARAARDLGVAEVHVVEASAGLMPRQLDATGASLLARKVEQQGVRLHLRRRTARIEATAAGDRALCFEGGERLEVGMVVIAAGIRPRVDLAARAGLTLGKSGGIAVDDHLRTSDDRVFAVGECASHRGVTYGLAPPGYRMVDVLVDNLVGGDAAFEGADCSARLKLLGVTVASIGSHDEAAVPGSSVSSYCDGATYHKLVIARGRVVGAITVGDWEDLERLSSAPDEPVPVSFWDMRRFRSTGHLWPKADSPPVSEWTPDAVVCGCLRVTRAALGEAMRGGCAEVADLSARTGAGSMCGACRPLLAELLSREGTRATEPDQQPPEAHARAAIRPPDSAPDTVRSAKSAPARAASPALVLPPAPAMGASIPVIPRAPALPISVVHASSGAVAPFVAAETNEGPLSRRGHALAVSDRGARSERSNRFDRSDRSPQTTARSPIATSAIAACAALAAPVSVPPISGPPPRDSTPPTSCRRPTMPPLCPISVPPGPASGRLPAPSMRALRFAPERAARALLAASLAAAALAIALPLLGPIAPSASIRGPRLEAVWTTSAGKQITGYAMIALALVTALLSLRKRWPRFAALDVPLWRAIHAAAGALALAALALHTGLHLGHRMTLALSVDFLALAAAGAVTGAITARSHRLPPTRARALRTFGSRAHLVLFWPLPALVAAHIVAAYYY